MNQSFLRYVCATLLLVAGELSFAATLDQVWVCGVYGNSRLVDFPKTLGHALQRGATLGLCEQDRPITP